MKHPVDLLGVHKSNNKVSIVALREKRKKAI